MARYQTASFTTSSVAAGEWLAINHAIYDSLINLVKIKVVPNEAGGTTRVQVYKRDTFLEADKLYDTREFTGALIDPVEDYSDPMTDTPGATAERNEGHLIPYEDDDATNEIHLRIYNGDVDAKTYTVTIKYEHVLVPTGLVGDVRVAGNLTVTETSTFGNDVTFNADSVFNGTVGIHVTNPLGWLANTATNLVHSDGVGMSTSGLLWRNGLAGWAAGFGIATGVSTCYGVLIRGEPSANAPLLAVESTSYPNTLFARADGRVGIAINPTAGVLQINGNQSPSIAALVVDRSVAGGNLCYIASNGGDDQPVIYSVSSSPNYGPNLSLAYTTLVCINIVTSAAGTIIDMLPIARSVSAPGSVINLGRNTSGVAGYVNFMNNAGTAGCVWMDAAGNLRIAGSGPHVAGDTGGVVVGTQTSTPEAKQGIQPVTPDERTAVVQRMFNAPLFTYELIGEAEAGFAGLKHLGFMSDQQPMWMHYDEKSIDEHRISMELLVALQELAKFVGYAPAPPGGPPAGVGRFIDGEMGKK